MTKILIADDHAIVREGIRALLEAKGGFEVVGEAASGLEALQECQALNPDILLLDLDLPGMDGLDVTRKIREEKINVRVVILTMHMNEEYAVRLFQSGACAFVPKASSGKHLPDIIRSVMDGKIFIPEEMRDTIMARLVTPDKSGVDSLTDREMQVFKGLAEGLSVKETADRLGISHKTVETHKIKLMDKLGLNSTADIFKAALRMGLIGKF